MQRIPRRSGRPGDGDSPLLERAAEIALIGRCLADAANRVGTVLLVEGPPGIGKTALLDIARAQAREAGFATYSSRGTVFEREFAFGVLRQCFEPAVGGLTATQRAKLLVGAARLGAAALDFTSGSAPSTFATWHGLYWLLSGLAADRPALLCVDDAHWADLPSLGWLSYVRDRVRELPVVLLVASRPPEEGPAGALLRELGAGAARTTLTTLSVESVAAIATAEFDDPPDTEFIAACYSVTGGNPYLVRELLTDLRRQRVRPVAASVPQVGSRSPESVVRQVLVRLDPLPPAARAVARALAVLGDEAPLWRVASLADLEPAVAAEAVDELRVAAVLLPEPPLRFVHPLVRTAVYDELPAGRRGRMHLTAAELLESEGADPEAVAAHLLSAEPVGFPTAVGQLRRAAITALDRGAPATAVTYLRRALREPVGDPVQTELLVELGGAEARAGDPAAADHLEMALARATDSSRRGWIALTLAHHLYHRGQSDRTVALLLAALDEATTADPALAISLETLLAAVTALDGRFRRVVEGRLPRLRVLAATAEPAVAALRLTLAMLDSVGVTACGDVPGAVADALANGRFLAAETSDSLAAAHGLYALVFTDRLDEAERLTESILTAAATRGSVLDHVAGSAHRGLVGLRSGRLPEAEADLIAAADVARSHRLDFPLPFVAAYLAETQFERGRVDDALRMLEDVPLHPTMLDHPLGTTVLEIRGRLRCALGRSRDGIADLRRCGVACSTIGVLNPNAHAWRSTLAHALAGTRPEEARELAIDELADARRAGTPRGIGVALRACAAVEKAAPAAALLSEARDVLRGSPAVLELGRVLLDLGSRQRALGDRSAARETLREALDIADRCDAVTLAQRIRPELYAVGLRPRRASRSGANALTPGELRVVRLAAQGRPNREIAQELFITVKTVKDHLTAAYRKLGIRSRSELGNVLLRDASTAPAPQRRAVAREVKK